MIPLFTRSTFHKCCISLAILILLLSPLLFSLVVNYWFTQYEASILAFLNETFRVPVEIGQIRYSLFKGILLDNFVLGGGIDPALPSPIRVSRIRIRPSVSFFPHPGFQLGRVLFEEPTFSLCTNVPELIQAGRFLSSSPNRDRRFGPFYLRMRLSSLKIQKGKITLLSPRMESFRQEFEGIQLFLGRELFGGERLALQGHIAKNPKASFRFRAYVKNPLPETTHLDLLFDCREFTTAYLNPHLRNRLELPDEKLTAAIRVKVRKGRIFTSKGKIAFPQRIEGKDFFPRLVSLIVSSLRYEVRGEVKKERWQLNKLILRTAGIELKGKGEMRLSEETPVYNVSISSEKIAARKFRQILPELKISSGQVKLFFTLVGSKDKISPSLDLLLSDCAFQDTKLQLFWNKVDGRVRLSRDRIVVDEVWAFLNNFPLRLRGEIRRIGHPRLILELSTYPGQVSTLRPKNPLNAAVRFIGDFDQEGWNGDLWLTCFLYGEKGQEIGKWVIALHGLTVEGLLPQRFLQDFFEGRKFRCESFLVRQEGSKRILNHLAMRKVSFFLSGEPGMIRCDILEGPFKQGTLFLQGWVDIRQLPNFSWTVTGSISNADIVSLFNSFEKRFPVSGQLSVEGAWSQKNNSLQFLGRVRLSEGVVGPTAALQQFSDETGIEPLRQIQFREFSGHVAFCDGDLDLVNLKILSDQAKLLANLKVRGEWLTGTLSAKFPEASVRESSDLRRLLHYVGEKDWIDFDFRVAGSLEAPRIQWLSGEFKRKVEGKLSPSMKEQLAREMEKLLGAKDDRALRK